jgi:hypothetical protein
MSAFPNTPNGEREVTTGVVSSTPAPGGAVSRNTDKPIDGALIKQPPGS